MHVLVWPWWCLINILKVALYVATGNVNWLPKIKPKFLASVDGNICVFLIFIETGLTLFSVLMNFVFLCY